MLPFFFRKGLTLSVQNSLTYIALASRAVLSNIEQFCREFCARKKVLQTSTFRTFQTCWWMLSRGIRCLVSALMCRRANTLMPRIDFEFTAVIWHYERGGTLNLKARPRG